jgi:hypothetical protein
MADEKKADDVEKILHDEKSLEDRKQALIADLLKQREAAIAAFDEKLEKLGYHANSGKPRRSHHRKEKGGAAPAPAPTPAKAADKPKA